MMHSASTFILKTKRKRIRLHINRKRCESAEFFESVRCCLTYFSILRVTR